MMYVVLISAIVCSSMANGGLGATDGSDLMPS